MRTVCLLALLVVVLPGCGSGRDDLGGAPDVRGMEFVRATTMLDRADWKYTLCEGRPLQIFGSIEQLKVTRERKTGTKMLTLEVKGASSGTVYGCDGKPGRLQ